MTERAQGRSTLRPETHTALNVAAVTHSNAPPVTSALPSFCPESKSAVTADVYVHMLKFGSRLSFGNEMCEDCVESSSFRLNASHKHILVTRHTNRCVRGNGPD